MSDTHSFPIPFSQRSNVVRPFGLLAVGGLLCAVLAPAQDLSRYRDFQLGRDLPAIAQQLQMRPDQAKVVHRRPALIQELRWQADSLENLASLDPVKDVVFCFYNRKLSRIVVNYDRYKTEGMSTEDLIESITKLYGPAERPSASIRINAAEYGPQETVLARWEDAQYSANLIRSSYQPTYGLIVFSKQWDPLAVAARLSAADLDVQEAPQREAERLKVEAEERAAKQSKARQANRPNFRP